MRSKLGVWLTAALLAAGCGAAGPKSDADAVRQPWEEPGSRVLAIQTEPMSIAEQMKGQTGIVHMTVSEQGFLPPLLRVKEGSRVRIHLSNTGSKEHNLILPRFGIVAAVMPPGGENYIEFTASEKGRWPFFSDASGQEELGLVGTLVVE